MVSHIIPNSCNIQILNEPRKQHKCTIVVRSTHVLSTNKLYNYFSCMWHIQYKANPIMHYALLHYSVWNKHSKCKHVMFDVNHYFCQKEIHVYVNWWSMATIIVLLYSHAARELTYYNIEGMKGSLSHNATVTWVFY